MFGASGRGDDHRDGPRLVSAKTRDLAIQDVLTGEGINLRVNAKCIRSAGAGRHCRYVDCEAGSPSVAGHLLLPWRQPNTDDPARGSRRVMR